MTDFRSKGKGKDRKVYPVGSKKQPYGVSRKLAYGEVEALRNDGKRARLIKTNQKLDLYAPYESSLPGSSVGTTEDRIDGMKFSSYEQIERALNCTTSDAQAWAEVHPDQLAGKLKEEYDMFQAALNGKPKVQQREHGKIKDGDWIDPVGMVGFRNSKGNMDANKSDLDNYFSKDALMSARVSGGKLEFGTVDSARISMIIETVETDLPDGYYYPLEVDGQLKMEYRKNKDGTQKEFRKPKLDFDAPDSFLIRLEGENLSKFLDYLRHSKEDALRIDMNGDSKSSSATISEKYSDPNGDRKQRMIETVTSVTNSNVPVQTRVSVPVEFMRSTIRTMLGRGEFNNPKNAVLTLNLRNDYPVDIKTRKTGPNNEHIELEGLVAPRIE